LLSLVLTRDRPLRDLHSFPTRRSSDLHVTGDVLTFSQSARVTGQVDGNIRGANNNLTITGTIGKNVMVFEETFTLEPNGKIGGRSEEHTSELQSRFELVCRLLLEKKNE